MKKGVLRNLTKFTGKHLCHSLFFNKLQPQACNFIKKDTLAQVFSCELCEISKKIFFTEHLRTTASETTTSDAFKLNKKKYIRSQKHTINMLRVSTVNSRGIITEAIAKSTYG